MTIDDQHNDAQTQEDPDILPDGLKASQADLAKKLLERGVEQIDVIYFGSDGMFGFADINRSPKNIDLVDMVQEIFRFSSDLISWKEGRFEKDLGGEGCLTLDAQTAQIKLSHTGFARTDKDREEKTFSILDLIENGDFGPDDVVITQFMEAFKRQGVKFVNTWFYNNTEDEVYEYEGRLSDKPIDLRDLESAAELLSASKKFQNAVLEDLKEKGIHWDMGDFMRCISECVDQKTGQDEIDCLSSCGNVYLDVQSGSIVCEVSDNFQETIVRESSFVIPNESGIKPQVPRG